MAFASNLLAMLMLLAVLAGLTLRLPAPLVLAGGALLGAFLGQLLGIYHVVLLGDLAGKVASVLDNETLVAIPLLVLSGTLLGESCAFGQLRARLTGRMSALPGLLLALAGGGGDTKAPLVGLLERAAPASAFLVLLGDLLDRAYLAADLPVEQANASPDFTVAFMTAMAVPALLLAIGLCLAGRIEGPEADLPAKEGLRPAILAALAALSVPALILSGLASPTEAGAAGVGLALALRARWNREGQCRLGDCLDRALQRAAIPFAGLIAGLTFHLVFEGIGGQEMTRGLFAFASGQPSFFIALGLIVLLGLIIDPIALAILLLPLVGPFLIEQGNDVLAVGALFALAPLAGRIAVLPRLTATFTQCLALAGILLLPVSFDMFRTPAQDQETLLPKGSETEGFTPADTTDAPQHDADEDRHFAPPNENE
ncbi:MAG: TRAP transporter large permease subunit [Rhodospirillales bacterium]|jgi:hypothetical protein